MTIQTSTIDLTPGPEEQEHLLAFFSEAILSDVRKARRESDTVILRQVIDLAFIIGFNTAHKAGSGDSQATLDFIKEVRTRLAESIR